MSTPLIAALPGAVSVLVLIPGLDQHTVHWPGLPSIYLPWYLIINLLQTKGVSSRTRLQAGDQVVEINGEYVLKILSFSWPPLLREGGGAQGSPSHPRPPGGPRHGAEGGHRPSSSRETSSGR